MHVRSDHECPHYRRLTNLPPLKSEVERLLMSGSTNSFYSENFQALHLPLTGAALGFPGGTLKVYALEMKAGSSLLALPTVLRYARYSSLIKRAEELYFTKNLECK